MTPEIRSFVTLHSNVMQDTKTTWTGWRRDDESGRPIPIYNQIDYILCRLPQRGLLADARSYNGCMTSSDHRLVAAQLCLPRLYGISGLWKKRKTDACARLDVSKLATVRNEYVGRVQQSINRLNYDQTNTNTPLQHTWGKIMSVIKSDALDTAGTVTRDQLRRICG